MIFVALPEIVARSSVDLVKIGILLHIFELLLAGNFLGLRLGTARYLSTRKKLDRFQIWEVCLQSSCFRSFCLWLRNCQFFVHFFKLLDEIHLRLRWHHLIALWSILEMIHTRAILCIDIAHIFFKLISNITFIIYKVFVDLLKSLRSLFFCRLLFYLCLLWGFLLALLSLRGRLLHVPRYFCDL